MKDLLKSRSDAAQEAYTSKTLEDLPLWGMVELSTFSVRLHHFFCLGLGNSEP